MHFVERYGYENRLSLLGQAVLHDFIDLDVSMQLADDYKAPARVGAGTFKHVEAGVTIGPGRKFGYFRAKARVPKRWKGQRVVVCADMGGDMLLYVNGKVRQGLDWAHPHAVLLESAKGGETFDLLIEAVPTGHGRFERIALACFNRDVWDFWVDATLACQMAMALPAVRPNRFAQWHYPSVGASREVFTENARAEQIGAALKRAMGLVDWQRLGQLGAAPKTFFGDKQPPVKPQVTPDGAVRLAACARRARRELREVLDVRGPANRFGVITMPNSHLDVAWFWPLSETVRKIARTTSNVLRLMEQYPHARFGHSQALTYAYLKRYYPDLYVQVKRRVREGRWLPLGGQWVEADTHMASGESQVRQLLLGQRFFKREFGDICRAGWLPDIFGLSGNMPQLFAGGGVKSLFTVKQITNEDTTFPCSVFFWEGIDGSRIVGNSNIAYYNETFTPAHVLDAQHCFREKHLLDRVLKPYGMGDGGGGPSAVEYEAEARLADVADLPLVDNKARYEDFIAEAAMKPLPVWRGEIYQGAHRGTYTSIADLKRLNRLCEQRLREAELLAVVHGDRRHAGDLERWWKTVCTMQFHDILPGSSIDSVNTENMAALRACHGDIAALRDRLAARLARGRGGAAAFNPHSWTRTDLVTIPGTGAAEAHTQRVAEGRLALVTVDAFACRAVVPEPPPAVVRAAGRRLENGRFILKVDAAGRIVSCFDKKAARELVKGCGHGPGNELRLHTDIPGPGFHGVPNDAWEISEFHRDEFTALDKAEKIELEEVGPLRASLKVTHRFGKSRLVQSVRVYAHTDRVDFITHVEWNEHNRMLRVSFPVPVNAEVAQCEIPYGHIARPTHTNTSWDWSKFEVPCLRWVDVADGGYGVAVLNDSRHGYDVQRGRISLALLRATSYPDPTADRGAHDFTYAFMAHEGGPIDGGVLRAANALNAPLLCVPGRPLANGSFLTVDQPNVVIEAVKPAEEGDGFIVRLYEAANRRTLVRVRGGFTKVARCNLIEEDQSPAVAAKGTWTGVLRPFEIVTLRLLAEKTT